MKRRERLMLLFLLVVVLLGGLMFLWSGGKNLLPSLRGENLAEQVQKKELEVATLRDKKKKWEQFRGLSLPGGTGQAQRKAAIEEYHKYLGDMLAHCEFTADTKVTAGTAEVAGGTSARRDAPPFVRVTYTITGHGDENAITRFLEEFYKAPRLHQIRSITVRKPERERTAAEKALAAKSGLVMDAVVEALILEGADERKTLDPTWYRVTEETVKQLKEAGLAEEMQTSLKTLNGRTFYSEESFLKAVKPTLDEETLAKFKEKLLKFSLMRMEPIRQLALENRSYKDISGKNIFYGPPPALPETPGSKYGDPLQFIRLMMIDGTWLRTQVVLRDLAHPAEPPKTGSLEYRMNFPSSVTNSFAIPDGKGGILLEGHICKIDFDTRDVYFRVDPPGKEKSSDVEDRKDSEVKADEKTSKASKDAGSSKSSKSSKGSGSAEAIADKKEPKTPSKFYRIHIGESLKSAMIETDKNGKEKDKALSNAEVEQLGLKGPDDSAQ
jgi:hypothetical protein